MPSLVLYRDLAIDVKLDCWAAIRIGSFADGEPVAAHLPVAGDPFRKLARYAPRMSRGTEPCDSRSSQTSTVPQNSGPSVPREIRIPGIPHSTCSLAISTTCRQISACTCG